MKKIGLAVCYDTKNFGSQLQVLATVKKVEELDCKSEIIRYKKKITPTFIVQTIPRLFNISFVKSKLSGNQKDNALKSKPFYQAQVQQRNQRFDAFVDKYFAPLFRNLMVVGKHLWQNARKTMMHFFVEVISFGCRIIWEAISTRLSLHRTIRRRLHMQRVLE